MAGRGVESGMPVSACGVWLSCRGDGGLWDFSFLRHAHSVPAPNHDHDHDVDPAGAHVHACFPCPCPFPIPFVHVHAPVSTSSSSKATDPPRNIPHQSIRFEAIHVN